MLDQHIDFIKKNEKNWKVWWESNSTLLTINTSVYTKLSISTLACLQFQLYKPSCPIHHLNSHCIVRQSLLPVIEFIYELKTLKLTIPQLIKAHGIRTHYYQFRLKIALSSLNPSCTWSFQCTQALTHTHLQFSLRDSKGVRS